MAYNKKSGKYLRILSYLATPRAICSVAIAICNLQ